MYENATGAKRQKYANIAMARGVVHNATKYHNSNTTKVALDAYLVSVA